MVIVTSNRSNHIDYIGMIGSSVMLICTVKLSPVVRELSGRVTVDIVWTGPNGDITQLSNNEQPAFVHSNNILCYMESDPHVFRCEDSIYKGIVTVTSLTHGFYNCTATITTQHPYINIMELSNGTRFTIG